jgi:predicted DNA-binding helix-hairpin-helix protein
MFIILLFPNDNLLIPVAQLDHLFYNSSMDTRDRLHLLSKEMHLEADCENEYNPIIQGKQMEEIPITEAVMPNGKRIKLLKTMITSACERNCYYCPFRAGRDMRRATFTPNVLAKTFMQLYYANAVEGLFLSSGIIGGGVRIQDKIIDTAEILRKKFNYRGYMHVKIMPGAEKDQVFRAMQLASRVSINLEAPNTERLNQLAPRKTFLNELFQPLIWAKEIRTNQSPHETWNGLWPSSATQFVVGAVGESDLELITTSEKLINQIGLKRIYYSKFNPIENTPLENHPPENPWRQHRLYQSSYLLRDYDFSLEELPFNQDGNLPLETDPKLAWAQKNLLHNPVEINQANKETLIRIPGIGHKNAERIIKARKCRKLQDSHQLRKLGILSKRSAPFILLNGKNDLLHSSF